MPGPRIYTKRWEQLKVAAAKEIEPRVAVAKEVRAKVAVVKEVEAKIAAIKEIESREPQQHPSHVEVPEKLKRRRSQRPLIAATALFAALSVLAVSLWIDSQSRLIAAARDAGNFKTRLEGLQETVKKLEGEKERLAEENGTLSAQYEERAAELTQREQELSQKERLRSKVKRPLLGSAPLSVEAAGAPSAGVSPVSSMLLHEKENSPKLSGSEQSSAKVQTIN
jgi:hypothetical protein